MAPTPLQQRRTHNTLLFQKLLNLRDGASPFTLILDNLEQRSGNVVREFGRRAKLSKTQTIYISFSTPRQRTPFTPSIFIPAHSKPLSTLRAEILSHIPNTTVANTSVPPIKTLLIIDTLHTLSTTHPTHLPTFLTSLLTTPQTSLLSTYHLDIPLPSPTSSSTPYAPPPLTTLLHLSTAILTLSPLSHTLSRKRCEDKSLPAPTFALGTQGEGVLHSLSTPTSKSTEAGIVIHANLRRRSGRGVVEDFVLLPPTSASLQPTITLLALHPLYAPEISLLSHSSPSQIEDEMATTFNLDLTDKQKRDRENVVLPYFDAQKGGGGMGPGDGGRILYDMGVEDREDFDDEEDE